MQGNLVRCPDDANAIMWGNPSLTDLPFLHHLLTLLHDILRQTISLTYLFHHMVPLCVRPLNPLICVSVVVPGVYFHRDGRKRPYTVQKSLKGSQRLSFHAKIIIYFPSGIFPWHFLTDLLVGNGQFEPLHHRRCLCGKMV